VGRPGPKWADWSSEDRYLPASFHKHTGRSSISQFFTWLKGNPLASAAGQKAGYQRVEKTILTIGLALRDVRTAALLEPGEGGEIPDYIRRSPFEIRDYEKILSECKLLLPPG
jgi:hypothetical protein